MATAQHDDDFHINNDLPPPAYELTSAELDRKIADAAQRSLAVSEQQSSRPILPPIDEDGFPAWDETLFEFNRAEREREREVEHARNSKAQSEYSRPSPHHHTAPSSSFASSSSSPPPSHAQARPVNPGRRSLPAPAPAPARSPNPDKQKQEHFGWLNNNPGGIAQDEDPHPPMTATQNAGRPPSIRPGAPLQVQVGPRPHDVLAQPQSPVSDVDDDFVAGGGAGLSRAPTYHPRGQAHPGHARAINERQQQPQRRSMESNGGGGLSRNGSLDLPPFTAVAPSLEGPAYEEVMRTTTPANRRVTSPAPPPPVSSMPPANERRQSGMEWKPVAARPQPRERVAGARQPTGGPGGARQPTGGPAQTWASSPSSYSPSPVTPSASRPTPAPVPAPAVAPMVAPRYGNFDAGLAYRSTQSYTLVGRTDSVSGSGVSEGQRVLREAGANAFYNAAVASTLTTAPVFKAPPPPPPRTATMSTFGSGVDDDVASVLSGRSGGGRPGSVYSGRAGVRSSMYGAPPPGGIMAGGAPPPVPAMPAQGYVPYQPGLGVQVSGAGGYQQNVGMNLPQPGAYQSMGGQPQAGGYQPQWATGPGAQSQSQGGYQPQGAYQSPAGAYQPQSMYQPHSPGAQQPQTQALQGGGMFSAGAGGYIPGQAAAPQPGQFVAPPPPPDAPAAGRKPGKLYKRL
ncbi:hypothetical protein FRC10_003375 [Ceratobasidium sp. 414]|nr:hypothetical protein FRC10_003375 [Ceratobasidium sp. 414]